jgi:hypothetical protein
MTIQDEIAYGGTKRTAAGLKALETGTPRLLKAGSEEFYLSGFAGTVDTFKSDKQD